MSSVTLMLAILAAVQVIHYSVNATKEPAIEKRTRDFGAKSMKEAEDDAGTM